MEDDLDPETRRRAEELLSGQAASAETATPLEASALWHELRVHQIVLEMQNEDLRGAQHELEVQREKHFGLFDLAPVGYLTLRDKGIVEDANLTAAHLLGVERQMLVGQPFSAFVLAIDRNAYYRHLELLKQTEAPTRCRRSSQVFGSPVCASSLWYR